jgi:hypothetical protein
MPTAQQVIDAIQAHNYAMAVVLILVAAVYAVRKIAPRIHGGLGAFLNSDRGGSLLVLIGGTGGALVTALSAGKHMSFSLLLGGIMTSAAASGGWNIVWDLFWPQDKKPAPSLASTVTPPASPPAAGWLLPFVLIPAALLLGSCGFCQQAANKDTARCRAERVVVDCGAPEVAKILLDVASQVAAALASDNWAPLLDGIVLDLEHRGIADAWGVVTCAIHQATTTAKAKASPQEAVMYAHGQSWMEKYPAKVKDAP